MANLEFGVTAPPTVEQRDLYDPEDWSAAKVREIIASLVHDGAAETIVQIVADLQGVIAANQATIAGLEDRITRAADKLRGW